MMYRLLRISVPAAIDSLSNAAAQLWLLSIVNQLSTAESAAHGIALRWEALSYQSGAAFGVAAMTLVGQHLGQQPARAARAGWTAYLLGGGIMVFFGLLFLFCAADVSPVLPASESATNYRGRRPGATACRVRDAGTGFDNDLYRGIARCRRHAGAGAVHVVRLSRDSHSAGVFADMHADRPGTVGNVAGATVGPLRGVAGDVRGFVGARRFLRGTVRGRPLENDSRLMSILVSRDAQRSADAPALLRVAANRISEQPRRSLPRR